MTKYQIILQDPIESVGEVGRKIVSSVIAQPGMSEIVIDILQSKLRIY